MANQNSTKNLVCPFCSLHCDDIQVKTNGKKYNVVENISCRKKIESYNINRHSNTYPLMKNKIISLSDAIKKIKDIVNSHKEILILNHGIELSGLRSILNFASQHNSIIDHINSKYLFQNIGVVQRTGYIATSLTETKNRADTIIVIGNKIFDKSPRLIDKVLLPKHSLCSNKNNRNVILIGNFPIKIQKEIKNRCKLTNIKIDLDLVPDLLKNLQKEKGKAIKGVSANTEIKLKNIISKSKYLVTTWAASDFMKNKKPEIIINSICGYIVNLNQTQRAACMPISGSLADVTSSQAMTWMTGFPSRIKHVSNSFKHDRESYYSENLISKKNVDLVLHISTISPDKIEINKKIKNIVIGHPNSTFTNQPDIFIPVGIPGIDYEGIMFRTDNVVSVALKDVRNISLPNSQSILDKLA